MMLQGRVAPPPSPATALATPKQPDASILRPQSLSRRNSFSTDTAASIVQLRSRTLDESSQDIRLHVHDATKTLSPRRSVSFTHHTSNPLVSNDVAMNALAMASNVSSNGTLRPTQSDLDIKTSALNKEVCLSNLQIGVASSNTLSSEHQSYSISCRLSQHEYGDEGDVKIKGQHDAEPESPISSSYSSASPTREQDECFETWVQERDLHLDALDAPQCAPDVASSSAVDTGGQSRIDSFTREINGWLLRESTSSLELSKTVQQIELDIRHALDSAATRVNADLQRNDQFAQELRVAELGVSSSGASYQSSKNEVSATEPELLLLMEVLIGDGRSETIEIHVGDRPDELAIAFAQKHGLVADAVPRLTQHIEDQLAALDTEGETEDTQAYASQDISDGVGQSDEDKDERVATEWNWTGDDIYVPSTQDLSPPAAPVSVSINGIESIELGSNIPIPPHNDERELKYNILMEKYGHYTSHSGRIDTSSSHRSSHTMSTTSDDHDLARIVFTRNSRPASGRRKENTVYDRLYALAEHKEKWIRRQQKLKAQEAAKERGAMKLDISVRSRELLAHRTNNGYAHIGERLYEEALVDMARKSQASERRAEERESEVDWTCPKCAFVNHHRDDVCKNIIASLSSANGSGTNLSNARRDSVGGLLDNSEVLCGQPRPETLFRPTLLAPSVPVARALSIHKRAGSDTTPRRQKNQQWIEEEFRQTCPFRPTINEVSIEIMRQKEENEIKASGSENGSDGPIRRKDTYQALYEDAFHSKAQKQAREQEYLNQFSFKPNIGVNALWMTGNERLVSTDDVVERLTVSNYQELERKRLSLLEKYAPDKDPHTGKEYFKPEIGRAPIFNRNERNLPIGEFLYECHREQAEYHRRLKQQDIRAIKQQQQQSFVSETSKQALQARKNRTFTRVFDMLVQFSQPNSTDVIDGNKKDDIEQRVVPSRVPLDQLSQEIRSVISIVFEYANHEPFTRQEFDGYMDKLVTEVPGLTYTQILFLAENLHDGKSSRRSIEKPLPNEDIDDPEYTFHPTIDKNSATMAQRHGRVEKKVFEALNQYYEHYQQRKKMIKKEQEREFARKHPFQPTFVTKDRAAKAATFYAKIQRKVSTPPHQSQPTYPPVHVNKSTLRTAVVNARPCVRPIERKPSSSISKHDSVEPVKDPPISQHHSISPTIGSHVKL